MLSLSIVLLLGHSTPQIPAHIGVQEHGKLGTWYWSSSAARVLEEDDDGDGESAPRRQYFPKTDWLNTAKSSITLGSNTSVQVNGNASGGNIPGDAANEPSLSVDPTNPNHLIVGWRQFDHVASNFRQAGNAYSLNGGQTWINQVVLTPGLFRSDPVLGANADGKFFYNSLRETFFTDVFGSTNQGQSWLLQGPATGGDKQWMTIDQTSGIGRGFMYESWSTAGNNYGGRQFSRSTDGGATWLNPINIPGSPIWGTLDVAKNGNLYLCGLGNNSFEFCRSTNAQNSAQVPSFDLVKPVNLGGAIVFGSSINPAGLLGQAWIATDKSAGPFSGNIYMVCSVGVDNQNPCQVNFARSVDGGQTWSNPKTLNDDLPNRGASHWFGTLAVAPNGRLDACWYDNRANPAISDSALFRSSSYDGGTTWTPSVQLSPYFNPNIGYPNQSKMGDYLGMISDSRSANIAYSATFNGEEDIWFLHATPTATQPVNATAISTYEGIYAGGQLSDIWSPDGKTYNVTSSKIVQLGDATSVQALFKLPITDVASLGIKLRAITTLPTTGMVWLYNWKTNQYDFQQSFKWPGRLSKDLTVNFKVLSDTYVDVNRNVQCVVRFLVPTRLGVGGLKTQFDLVQLLYG